VLLYNYETASAHIGSLLGRSLRLVGEYTYDFQAKAKLSVGLVSALGDIPNAENQPVFGVLTTGLPIRALFWHIK